MLFSHKPISSGFETIHTPSHPYINCMNDEKSTEELLDLSKRLLDAIDAGDWDAYTGYCDPNLTAFEPEALGHLVEGMPFHRYYFELEANGPKQSSISSPRVWVHGDVGVVTYVRLTQSLDSQGAPQSTAFEETRVWKRDGDRWLHVHFHRSGN